MKTKFKKWFQKELEEQTSKALCCAFDKVLDGIGEDMDMTIRNVGKSAGIVRVVDTNTFYEVKAQSLESMVSDYIESFGGGRGLFEIEQLADEFEKQAKRLRSASLFGK